LVAVAVAAGPLLLQELQQHMEEAVQAVPLQNLPSPQALSPSR